MDYAAALDYLYQMLPMYQRQGPMAYKKDLTNTLELTKALGRPQHRFPSLHIAGTNGKGSVAHLCASVLQASGYKIGLYTSPHLKDFRERIRLNGVPISETEVLEFVKEHRALITRIEPSFFEVTVAMAFDRFAVWDVDLAVVETGLGGRLDSTNILHPLVSVITSIGHDHQALLGPDLSSIAREKAGIIKPGVPVVIGELRPETFPVFAQVAEQNQAPLYLAPETIVLSDFEELPDGLQFYWQMAGGKWSAPLRSALAGDYQRSNLRTVIQALLLLEEHGFPLREDALADGLWNVRQRTGFRGRWDVLQRQPCLIVDGAHNPEGLQVLFAQVQRMPHQHLHIVTGTVNDKDLAEVLPCFPVQARYYFARPDIPRGLSALQLQEQAANYGLQGSVYASVADALQQALQSAQSDDLVLVCGSLFVVAEVPYEQFEPTPDSIP
ncbi:MAG: bifunctional folylpolyglutamate synthase/dihydrofolate synthase [Bacteroidetes bacterium]|nr:bifunctional folylpolyglutamate synthase/dihydrofolate synthase [Bacteroidota bacterium]